MSAIGALGSVSSAGIGTHGHMYRSTSLEESARGYAEDATRYADVEHPPLPLKASNLQHLLGESTRKSLDLLMEKYDGRQQRMVEARVDNLSQRMEVQHRLDNLEIHLERLRDSFEALMKKVNVNVSKPDGTPRKPSSRLRKLANEVHLDLEAFDSQCQDLKSLSTSLRDHDKKWEASELAFDNVCRNIFHELRVRQLVSGDATEDDISLKSTSYFKSADSASTPLPMVKELADYFAAYSRLRHMSERIDDLTGEQLEQRERRDLLRDQEQVLDQTDEEFSAKWDQILGPATKDYEEALLAVESTRKLCSDAGIEIPAWARIDARPASNVISIPDKPSAEESAGYAPSNRVPDSARISSELHDMPQEKTAQSLEPSLQGVSEGVTNDERAYSKSEGTEPNSRIREYRYDQPTNAHIHHDNLVGIDHVQGGMPFTRDSTRNVWTTDVPAQGGVDKLEASRPQLGSDGQTASKRDEDELEYLYGQQLDIRTQRDPPSRTAECPMHPTGVSESSQLAAPNDQAVSISRPIATLPIVSARDDQHDQRHSSYVNVQPPNPTGPGVAGTTLGSVGRGRSVETHSINHNARVGRLFSSQPPGGRQPVVLHQPTINPASRILNHSGPGMTRVLAVSNEQIALDEGYQLRKHPAKFFQIGKVFLMLHTEPYGQSRSTRYSSVSSNSVEQNLFRVAPGELASSKIRRFIVIREGINACQTLAISTRVGKSATRSDEPDRGVVYTGSRPPPVLRHEIGILPNAIRIDLYDPVDKLPPSSRLNYGKIYTVEHNVKVKPLGTVNNKSMHLLIQQFTEVFFRTNATPVTTAIGQPTSTNLKALGFKESQVKAALNMIANKGAAPETAISSVARMSAMPDFADKERQQDLAGHVVDLVMAGLPYTQAVEQVKLVEDKQKERGEDDNASHSDDVELSGDDNDDEDVGWKFG